MAENTNSKLLARRMSPERARQRIEAFRQRFDEPHWYFAQHAAFPLALTSDLLYRLWANFQRNIDDDPLRTPWMAVADLLLSPLCEEVDVGYELYEMDITVRMLLLDDLQTNPRFGKKRIDELSSFLQAYALQQLKSSDLTIRSTAQGQRWTALAYTRPEVVAHELAEALTVLYKKNALEQVRIASLLEMLGTLAKPLAALEGFAPLLVYVQNVAFSMMEGTDTMQAQSDSTAEIERREERKTQAKVLSPSSLHNVFPYNDTRPFSAASGQNSLVIGWLQFTEEKWRTVSDSQLGWKPLRGRWSGWDDIFQDTYGAQAADLAQAAQDAGEATARRFENSEDKGSAASAVVCFIRDVMILRLVNDPSGPYFGENAIGSGRKPNAVTSLVIDWLQFTEEKWRTVSDSQLGWKPLRGRWHGWSDIFQDVYGARTLDPIAQATQNAENAVARRFETAKEKGSAASAVVCFLCDIIILRNGIEILIED